MHNIVLLIIDSLNYSRVQATDYTVMPYLKGLEREGVSCSSMFSEAPYTEAASMNIYCGQDTLQNNGYILRYKDAPKVLFEVLQEAGYETYYNSYQPQCHPTSITRGVDKLYYNVGFDLNAFWSYRLAHYAGLIKNGELNNNDYIVLEELFDSNFRGWLTFVNGIAFDKQTCNMIRKNNKTYNADEVKLCVSTEYNKYRSDKRDYINSVLTIGTKHTLFQIPAFVQQNRIADESAIPDIQKLFKPLFKNIRKKNIAINLRNNKGLFKCAHKKAKALLSHPSKQNLKNYLKALYIPVNTIVDLDLFERLDVNNFKCAPSVISHLNHFFDWVSGRLTDKPYFACIHVDDIHNPETFFTYDSSDLSLLNKQRELSQRYLESIPKDYKGIISHDLSLLYIDSVIDEFIHNLKEKQMLDNTTVIITADHGFSFAGYPLRDSFVINRYLENYHIPFVIYNSEHEKRRINRICRSTDIAATIVDLAGGKKPNNFSGISIFETPVETGRTAIIEYCGGGCPDFRRRSIISAAFDKEWFVGVDYSLTKKITNSEIVEIYDLRNDPLQLHNCVNSEYNIKSIEKLLDVLKERQRQIDASRSIQ